MCDSCGCTHKTHKKKGRGIFEIPEDAVNLNMDGTRS